MEIQAFLPQNIWDFSQLRGITRLFRSHGLQPIRICCRAIVCPPNSCMVDIDCYSHSYLLPSRGTRKNVREEQWRARSTRDRQREF